MTIGSTENINDKSFIDRINGEVKGNICTDVKYKWSEIKSSLLIQAMIYNDKTYRNLTVFVQSIAINIFTVLNIDLGGQLVKYMEMLDSSEQKDIYQSYPVSQSKAWSQNLAGLWNDLYGMTNFIKWVWFNLVSGVYYHHEVCEKYPVFYYFIINTFQQKISKIHGMIRGGRLDLPPHGQPVTDNIGIVDFNIPELKRFVKGNPNFIVEPWLHPGQNQCKVAYLGNYGKLIEKYRKENDFYGSLQCGISGSTQFTLFLYLMGYFENSDIDKNIANLIMTNCMILTGDGGHNIREIIFGLTCSIVILHNIIDDVAKELQISFGNTLTMEENNIILQNIDKNHIYYDGGIMFKIYNFISDMIGVVHCDKMVDNDIRKEIFDMIVNSLTKWKPFIYRFYEYTRDINIVGVYKDDLNKYDPVILENKNKSFEIAKKNMYNFIFEPNTSDDYNHSMVQVFFALESNRYLLDTDESFKKSASKKIANILEIYHPDILPMVNIELQKQLSKCPFGPPINVTAENIPFA